MVGFPLVMTKDPDDFNQPDFYRFSEDSLYLGKRANQILSNYLKVRNEVNVLEIGAGCGVVGLTFLDNFSVNHKNVQPKLLMLEKQNEFLPYLIKNVNDWKPRFQRVMEHEPIIEIQLEDFLEESTLKSESFFAILMNPPYFFEGEGQVSLNLNKETCRRMKEEDFYHWIKKCFSLLEETGILFFVHRNQNLQAKDFQFNELVCEKRSKGFSFYAWEKLSTR